jgi:hypothetical protein
MATRWYVFSAPVRAGASNSVRAFAVALVLAAVAPAARAATPEASPSPVASGAEFLELKAYDLAFVKPAPNPIRVGDKLELKITAAEGIPQGSRLETPFDESTLAEQGLDITLQEELAALVVPIKPGSLTIPALVIKDPSGATVGRTYPQVIQVVSVIAADDPKAQQPVELKPPVGLKFPWLIAAVIGLAALLLLAAGIHALVRWSRKRRALAQAAIPPAPPRPEDELALEALAAIEKQGLVAIGKHKAHYFGISEVMKKYVGARYGFDALESTTYELIRTLEERKAGSPQILDGYDSLFQRLDQVKFTDHVPGEAEARAALDDARKLVLATRKPKVVPVAEGPAVTGGVRAP